MNGTHCGFEEAPTFREDECIANEYIDCLRFGISDYNTSITHENQFGFVEKYMSLFAKAVLYDFNDFNAYLQDIAAIKQDLSGDAQSGLMGNWNVNC